MQEELRLQKHLNRPLLGASGLYTKRQNQHWHWCTDDKRRDAFLSLMIKTWRHFRLLCNTQAIVHACGQQGDHSSDATTAPTFPVPLRASVSFLLLLLICRFPFSKIMTSIEQSSFGKTPDGKEVFLFKLKNENGFEVHLMSYGAAIVKILAPDRWATKKKKTQRPQSLKLTKKNKK